MSIEKIESSKLLRDPSEPRANKITTTMKPLNSRQATFLGENREHLSHVHETHQREGMNSQHHIFLMFQNIFHSFRLHVTQAATIAQGASCWRSSIITSQKSCNS
jgi:hypothetical protein